MGKVLTRMKPLGVFAVLLVAACYEPPETIGLTQDADMLDGRSVGLVFEDGYTFGLWTHGRSGQWIDVAKFLDAAEIKDPAPEMEAALARQLVEHTGVKDMGSPLSFGSKKPDDLVAWAREHAVTDLMIDVETEEWGLEWWSSSVRYEAVFRLIDPVSGQTVAQHLCDMKSPELEPGPKTPQNPFPQDEVSRALLVDNAAPIKAIINNLAEECVEAVGHAAQLGTQQ